MISNVFLVFNNEISCKDCEAIFDVVLVEGKEDIVCKVMDNYFFVNMFE